MQPSKDISRLIEIMAQLRAPGTGCAWDIAQTPSSLAPYVVEEAYEVVDAIERGEQGDLREELGDLLLQVVFQARLAEEEGSFAFGGIVEAITAKLIRRHPHIFGERRDLTPDEVKVLWSAVKKREKNEKAARGGPDAATADTGLLASVPTGVPPLPRAIMIQAKAAEVGFDWNDARAVLAKIREEADEVEGALGDRPALIDEIGDLMFAIVNLARHANVDPDAALRAANRKFERRFAFIERELKSQGRTLLAADLAEMEALWASAKAMERVRPAPA